MGQQPFQLPNPNDNQSTLVLNQDTTFSIDLSPDDTFSFTQTYTLDPQEGINWPQGGTLYARISPGQTASGVIVWVQPGGTVAPPHAISVSGGVNAQALQGYPISATPPGNKQGLVWDATSSSWIPANLVNSVSAGQGIAVSGNTGDISVSNTGVTSVLAGSGIAVNQNTGQVTVTNTAPGFSGLGNTQAVLSADKTLPSVTRTPIVSVALSGANRTWQLVAWATLYVSQGVICDFGFYITGIGWISGNSQFINGTASTYNYATTSFLWNSGGNASVTMEFDIYVESPANGTARAASMNLGIGNATGMYAVALD